MTATDRSTAHSGSRSPHGRAIARKLTLAAVSLFLLLAVMELVLRVQHLDRGEIPSTIRIHDFFFYDANGCFRIRPHARGWHRSYDGGKPILAEINSEGLRGPELSTNPTERIAFLGDSITFDGGVEWTNTFAALVADRLNEGLGPGKRRFETLNCGTTDAGIEQYYLKLRDHVQGLQPRTVVVCFYLNDSRPPQGFLGETGREPWEHRLERSVLYKLFIVKSFHNRLRVWKYSGHPELMNRFAWVPRFQSQRYLHNLNEWNKLVEEARYDWGAAWDTNSWGIVGNYMARMQKLCEASGATLLWICLPVRPQVDITDNYPNLFLPQRTAKDIARKLGIPFCDMLPALSQHRGEPIYNDQCHLTTLGNRVVADALATWLKNETGEQKEP